MKKSILALWAASALVCMACEKEIPYNSNSGENGTRDSAAVIQFDKVTTGQISAPDGDNEDWFYVFPSEEGKVNVSIHWENHSGIDGQMVLCNGYGQAIQTLNIDSHQSDYTFNEQDVTPNRYFIAIKADKGKGTYSINSSFYVPQPDVVETTTDQSTDTSQQPQTRCVPASKCKPGQRCCKETIHTQDSPKPDPEPAPAPVVIAKGTIVLVTQRGDELCDIKISGIGTQNQIQPGKKAVVRGLNRSVDIYKCFNTSCMATVKATPEELNRYDKIEVYSE